MRYLSLGLALALVAGLALGVSLDGRRLALVESLTLSAAWALALLGYRSRLLRLQLVSVSVLVAAAGCVLGEHAVDRALHPSLRTIFEQRFGGFSIDEWADRRPDEPVIIEGRLREDASPSESGATLRIDVTEAWIGAAAIPVDGGIAVGVGGAMHGERLGDWTSGRFVRAPMLLRRPATYLNEGLPDQERALARRGITLVGTIKSARLVEVVSRGWWWEEAAARIRGRTRAAIQRHVGVRDSQAAAIAVAILIGDRAGLDRDIELRLQEAGTYHVIAISGGNIAILAGLILGGAACVGIRGRAAAIAAIAALTAYALVAAGGASVARATLMAIVYLAVRLIDQRTAAVNAIGLTGAILLLASPLSIVDVAFWLTFGASAAIVIGAFSLPMRMASWRRAIATVFLASCSAEVVLAPVGALIFQRVTLAGLVVNFVALPAMTVLQVAAMAVVACDVLGLHVAADLSGRIVGAASSALTASAGLVDYAPWLTWRVPPPPLTLMIGYYAALIPAVWCSVAGRGQTMRAALYVTAAVLFLWIIVAPHTLVRAYDNGQLLITLIDVGQGDAILVRFPNGRHLLVDTGGVSVRGEFDIGDRIIGPSLRARGLVRLDYLAITHGDPDHIGGGRSIVRDFHPREVWWGVPVAHHAPAELLRREADGARAAWRTLQRGDRLEIGGVELRVHHPPPPDWERQKVRNDDSLVMELRFGNVSVLLTGDIATTTEAEILPALDLLPTVVLKVAHHGSGTSTTPSFVERVRPEIALIGVGRGNPYGHPVPYVLERLAGIGAAVFRTDLDGQIDVSTDGRTLSVRTFTGRTLSKKHEDHEGR